MRTIGLGAALIALAGTSLVPQGKPFASAPSRNRTRGRMAEHQEFSPAVQTERARERKRNRQFAEAYMAREARG